MTTMLARRSTARLGCALVLCAAACTRTPDAPSAPEPAPGFRSAHERTSAASAQASAATATLAAPAVSVGPVSAAPATATVDTAAYPWLADRTCSSQTVKEPLSARFAPPSGFERARVSPGSFGQWLRGLPLRPKGAVLDYKGRVVLEEGDPRLAAVVALDEGTADLQQCADSVMRLHAEWLWSKGNRTMSYRAASKTVMPFEKWLLGERPSAEGNSLVWKPAARRSDENDHGVFRSFMDAVFMWANTGALARDAQKISLDEVRPGDFFVLAGSPGHAVLILDVVKNESGNRALLLGQGYMPAQSFHVLRSSAETAWFSVDAAAGGMQTPFWPAPFPWSSLRRLD